MSIKFLFVLKFFSISSFGPKFSNNWNRKTGFSENRTFLQIFWLVFQFFWLAPLWLFSPWPKIDFCTCLCLFFEHFNDNFSSFLYFLDHFQLGFCKGFFCSWNKIQYFYAERRNIGCNLLPHKSLKQMFFNSHYLTKVVKMVSYCNSDHTIS